MSKTVLLSIALAAGSSSLTFAQPPAPGAQPAQPPAPGAQPAVQAPAPAKPATPRTIPAWSDPELAKIGKMLAGTWKSAPVAQAGSAGQTTEIVMTIAQVANSELKDTMYVETARLDSLHAPYRQAIFQLYTFKGKPRLRTYEFTGTGYDPAALTGLWNAPELFPDVKRSNLIATLDVELASAGGGYSGKTPYPYPTGVGGAVEMTSELSVSADSLTSADRGYDAAGKIVWGSSEKDKYTFSRFKAPIKAEKRSNGLFTVEYKHPSEGRAIENNDRVGVHFTGWLTNGVKWDGSRERPQPAIFQVGGSPMAGLNEGLIGATKGTIMRMYMPTALAFGDKGYRIIPPNEDIILEIEVMSVEPPPAPVSPAGAAGAQPSPGQPKGGQPSGGQPPAPIPAPPPQPPAGPKK